MIRELVEDSSLINSQGYDPNSNTLEVMFRNGRIYQYYGVEPSIHKDFLQARSKGNYLKTFLEVHYPFKEIYNQQEPPDGD